MYMTYEKKYLKYKEKYFKLKNKILLGGTLLVAGDTHKVLFKIRRKYHTEDVSNNLNEEEYGTINGLADESYFDELYKENNFAGNKKDILDKFSLIYKKLFLKGVGIEKYPYGIFQLKNYISLTNEFIDLYNKNVIRRTSDENLEFNYINYKFLDDGKEDKFIEVIRVEKDIDDNFVFQDFKSEKISDPGYVLKGIYYYPCLGSGVFLKVSNIKYYYNKLHAISEMHHELIQIELAQAAANPSVSSSPLPPPSSSSPIQRAPSAYMPTESKFAKMINDDNLFSTVTKEEIIMKFITKFKFGRFDPSKSVVLSNINYICGAAKKFNYLNEIGILKYLIDLFCKDKDIDKCDDTIKKNIYEIYYKIFSGELTLGDLNTLGQTNAETQNINFSKSIKYLIDLSDQHSTYNISSLLKDKIILSNFINKSQYLSNHIYKYKKNDTYLNDTTKEDIEKLIKNIMIEIYSQIYNANFNQLNIDATLYYYARKLEIDTVVILLEPTDKDEMFGSEVISIEDFQLDSYNRTINYRKIKRDLKDSFNTSLNTYLDQFLIK